VKIRRIGRRKEGNEKGASLLLSSLLSLARPVETTADAFDHSPVEVW